jgi:hypothetical protein
VRAPEAPGERLVPDTNVTVTSDGVTVGTGGEIRLTYDQLTALIDDAVRQLVKS